jgi:hypothetical protein
MKADTFCGMSLNSVLLKQLRGDVVTLDDVQDYDRELYGSLKSLLSGPIGDLCYCFTAPDGTELIDGGETIEVTPENAEAFVCKYLEYLFVKRQEAQLREFLSGFHEMFPIDEVQLFSIAELKERLYLLPEIRVDDLRKNVKFTFPREIGEVEQREYADVFFRVLSNWNQRDLEKLVCFITGLTGLPVKYGVCREDFDITISLVSGGPGKLPVSSTCTRTLKIPLYPSDEIMDERLKIAISSTEFTRT